MPAPANVPDYLELVRKSGLVAPEKIDQLLAQHRATGTPQNVDQAAAFLIRDGLLTYFQAKQIKYGRYKRFTIGSKYRLLELIGAGGMGAVYLCEHMLMKRLVALKVLPHEKMADPSNVDRFYREARAVAALDHPNIVRAYDIDQFDKLHFLVMEYVDGHSLQEIVARYVLQRKFFDPIRAAHYIAQAAVGMQHAHELGMVHRDIKPGNLLLDRTGVIKVLDMGLARFFNKQQDSVTEKYDDKCVLGTADYLAPEQAVTNIVDVRADIYSLGGTLYFLLTGQTPFPEGTIAAKLVAHQTREPKRVESFRSDVPAGILAVLRKMMAKDVDERYQTPLEVAEALAEWTEIPIPPPPEREMPNLCPLVRSLIGGPADKGAAQQSLSRLLFAPGRGVFTRVGGSSVNLRPRDGSSSTDSATASNAAFPVAPGETAASPAAALASSPGSTRSTPPALQPGKNGSGAHTAMKSPVRTTLSGPMAEFDSAPRVWGLPVRTWLVGAAAIGAVVVLTVAVTIAYKLGQDAGKLPPQPTPPPEAHSPSDHLPSPADVLLTPAQAASKLGEVHTVEFTVRSVNIGADVLLNSETELTNKNLSVRIPAAYFQSSGHRREQLEHEYLGQTIRVRGSITADPIFGRIIDVRTPQHVIIVNRE
ncbi:MAG: serine/threonine-protein kinase [Gemmataceae bacterium]|nr:serine/threonine protein kinase [Gemmata sp.]MDW8197957.1 serine/threonine-protein kinase [Gemmataceae bacterium]